MGQGCSKIAPTKNLNAQDGEQNILRQSKDGPDMEQDVCLGLSWAFIFAHLRRSLALPSLRLYYVAQVYMLLQLLLSLLLLLQLLPWLPRLPLLLT